MASTERSVLKGKQNPSSQESSQFSLVNQIRMKPNLRASPENDSNMPMPQFDRNAKTSIPPIFHRARSDKHHEKLPCWGESFWSDEYRGPINNARFPLLDEALIPARGWRLPTDYGGGTRSTVSQTEIGSRGFPISSTVSTTHLQIGSKLMQSNVSKVGSSYSGDNYSVNIDNARKWKNNEQMRNPD